MPSRGMHTSQIQEQLVCFMFPVQLLLVSPSCRILANLNLNCCDLCAATMQTATKQRNSGRRRTTGWQAENSNRTRRERSTHDSDEDFGGLAKRNFFPATSSTGFSNDEVVPGTHDAIETAPSAAEDIEGILQRRGSATALMSGSDCTIFENSLYLDSRRSSDVL